MLGIVFFNAFATVKMQTTHHCSDGLLTSAAEPRLKSKGWNLPQCIPSDFHRRNGQLENMNSVFHMNMAIVPSKKRNSMCSYFSKKRRGEESFSDFASRNLNCLRLQPLFFGKRGGESTPKRIGKPLWIAI